MHIFRNYLRNKYHISNYQISQIFFLFKTLASEMSKIIIMGFLFSNQLSHYIYALFIRRTGVLISKNIQWVW